MSEDNVVDEVGREIDAALRTALTGLAQMQEILARRQMQRDMEALRAARQQRQEVTAELAARQQAARMVYLAPQQMRWWETATADDVARAWHTARALAGHDPQAAQAQAAIEQTVRDRWGIDIESVNASVSALDDARQVSDRAQETRDLVDDLTHDQGEDLDQDQAQADGQEQGETPEAGPAPGPMAAPDGAASAGGTATGGAAAEGVSTPDRPGADRSQQTAAAAAALSRARAAAAPGFPRSARADVARGAGRTGKPSTGRVPGLGPAVERDRGRSGR